MKIIVEFEVDEADKEWGIGELLEDMAADTFTKEEEEAEMIEFFKDRNIGFLNEGKWRIER